MQLPIMRVYWLDSPHENRTTGVVGVAVMSRAEKQQARADGVSADTGM